MKVFFLFFLMRIGATAPGLGSCRVSSDGQKKKNNQTNNNNKKELKSDFRPCRVWLPIIGLKEKKTDPIKFEERDIFSSSSFFD